MKTFHWILEQINMPFKFANPFVVFDSYLETLANEIRQNDLLNCIKEYQQEIVGTKLASDFIFQHDPSLMKCLTLAEQHGYAKLSKINVEILASLLLNFYIQQELSEAMPKITSILEQLN